MKKILFVLALVMSAVTMMAEDVRVTTKDGLVIAGEFINGTDSTYTIKCSKDIRAYIINKYGTDTVVFDLEDIHQVQMYGKVFVPINGKLIVAATGKNLQKSEIKLDPVSNTYLLQPSNPGEVIGKALKTTGGISLGIGIPCLVTGSILMAVGMTGYSKERSQMATAGCILFPIGASLTIVGIPLHAHGKKIMTMNFNYTGNGVGVGLEF